MDKKKIRTSKYYDYGYFGKVQANPNNNDQNFIIWLVINLMAIAFIVTIITTGIFSWVSFIFEFIVSKYTPQFLLFLLVLLFDGIMTFFLKDADIINSGVASMVIYFIADYFYLQTHYINFSLMYLINN